MRGALKKGNSVDIVIHAVQHIPVWLVYLVLAVFLLLESSGIPLLNSTLLFCTGALAAMGHLNMVYLFVVGLLGSVLGACVAYLLGRRYGEACLHVVVRVLRMKERRVFWLQRWFQRSGGRLVFFSRIIPYIRPFTCFPAGIAAMPFRRFLLAVVSGSTLWCMACLLIGWELGPHWKVAVRLFHDYTVPTLVVVSLALLGMFFCRHLLSRSLRRRLAAEGE
jgi:membrane protein DedA with SNARE-associated domain